MKNLAYILMIFFSFAICYKVIPILWKDRHLKIRTARVVLMLLCVELIANTLYFGWWSVANYIGNPAWMINHYGITIITWFKVLPIILLFFYVRKLPHNE